MAEHASSLPPAYKEIAKHLRMIKEMYNCALKMRWEEQERIFLILTYAKAESMRMSPIMQACEYVLDTWSNGRWPYDDTLINVARDRVDSGYKGWFPEAFFDIEKCVFKWYNDQIRLVFDSILTVGLSRSELYSLNRLRAIVNNTLADNVNMRGDNPYYKRNYTHFTDSKKTWIHCLDRDFQSYIEYFEEE